MITLQAKSGGGQYAQGSGPTVDQSHTHVTPITANDSLTLRPAAVAVATSTRHSISNAGLVPVAIYPTIGERFDGLVPNAPFSVPAGRTANFVPSPTTAGVYHASLQ